jgi:hypothetical protein
MIRRRGRATNAPGLDFLDTLPRPRSPLDLLRASVRAGGLGAFYAGYVKAGTLLFYPRSKAMKTATVVEFDLKEIKACLIEKAKSSLKATTPGGSSIKFVYGLNGNDELSGVIIRFGQDVADEPLEPVEVVTEPLVEYGTAIDDRQYDVSGLDDQ